MLREVILVFNREISHRVRQPAWVVFGLLQPLLFMYFFGPLLTKFVAYTPGFPPGDTWQIFAPSLMLQMVLVGTSTVGLNLLVEHRSGVLERFRVTPLRQSALLLGKVACVTTYTLIQSSLILLLCRLSFHLNTTFPGVLAALGFTACLAVTLAASSYALALRLKNEETVPVVMNALLMPLLLLSGTFLPITSGLAPEWLFRLSQLNPVVYVMTATRAVFRGDFGNPGVGVGVLWAVATCALALTWSLRVFSTQGCE
ncbi:ABC transporter permease [Streptomyces sp. NPDC004658]|uniref:ABC transporter permease n=1 Tax=Streptomyces sp. NPDC004658 TaxID=3154672 RepID=UPI0033BA3646